MERVTPLFGASGSRVVRRCARPGCADAASATLAFRYDRSQAWLTPLVADKSPATYDLCGPCADRTAPPRGWELIDERPDLDARDVPNDDADTVRMAIASALREGMAPLLTAPEPAAPEPVAQEPAAPEVVPAALEPTAPAPVRRVAPRGPAVDPVRTPRAVLAVRPTRPRPVEVLISATPTDRRVDEVPAAATTRVTAASHAPVQHRLEVVTDHMDALDEPSPTGHVPTTEGSLAAPARDRGDQPLAFDALPDRLVPMGAESAVREA